MRMPSSPAALAAALCAFAPIAFAPIAFAHPALLASTPKPGDALDAAPKAIRLQFNEPIEVSFTRVTLLDAAGQALPAEPTQRDPSSSSAAIVALPPLATGTYKASWSAVGRDGHRVKGEFSFSVK